MLAPEAPVTYEYSTRTRIQQKLAPDELKAPDRQHKSSFTAEIVNASRSRRGQTGVHDQREVPRLKLGVRVATNLMFTNPTVSPVAALYFIDP